jgi:hypothetical protein
MPSMKAIEASPDTGCPALPRRLVLESLGGGLGMLAAAQVLAADAPTVVPGGTGGTGPHFMPRARRVIHLFMNGGPFQADLFDPKPALATYAGQRPEGANLRTERKTGGLMPSAASFAPRGESGVPVSDLLPRLGEHVDRICVLRSMHADNPNHGPALFQMNNGTILPTRPSIGSWMLYGLGSANDNLPGYVVLCPGRPVRFAELWTNAFLPAAYQGTYVNHSRLDGAGLIPYLGAVAGPRQDQRRMLDLLQRMNAAHRDARGPDAALDGRIAALETAFHMQTAAREAFDLAGETAATRAAYGEGHYATGCLLARRLVERGVRFVQVYYGNGQPWDTHSQHDEQVGKLCRTIDQPTAALLADLHARGLLEDTLVVWGGEFGRTPTTENGDGRDHNHHGFTMWLAGGGVRGGMTWGETDEFGFRAVENKVHVHDLHATILHLLGLDHERLTFRYAGRDYRLTDVHGRVVREILA